MAGLVHADIHFRIQMHTDDSSPLRWSPIRGFHFLHPHLSPESCTRNKTGTLKSALLHPSHWHFTSSYYDNSAPRNMLSQYLKSHDCCGWVPRNCCKLTEGITSTQDVFETWDGMVSLINRNSYTERTEQWLTHYWPRLVFNDPKPITMGQFGHLRGSRTSQKLKVRHFIAWRIASKSCYSRHIACNINQSDSTNKI